MKNNNLEDVKKPDSVSYYTFESERMRSEKREKRLWIALIIAIILIFASNVGWLIYESQFDQIEYSQDGGGINSINYGEQGGLNYEPESGN